jgi:hypothetical protein
MYFSHLEEKKLPWIYGLRFNEQRLALCLDINSIVIEFLNNNIEHFTEGFTRIASDQGFKNFTFVLDTQRKRFGYEAVGEVEYTEQMVSFILPLHSKRKNRTVRKKHVSKIARTLSVLLSLCKNFLYIEGEKMSDAEFVSPQLFEVETVTSSGWHGYCLGGFVSPKLRSFLCIQGDLDYGSSRIFRDAFMFQIKRFFGHNGHTLLGFEPDGGFIVQVPGNACDIAVYGDERSRPVEQGAEFDSHNVDSPQQQLGLLIGLAMILGWYYEKYPEHNYIR